MNTTIETWYNFVLQQMAAESYLNQAKQVDIAGQLNLQDVLMFELTGSASHYFRSHHATSPSH